MARKGNGSSAYIYTTESASPTAFTLAGWFKHAEAPANSQPLNDDMWNLYRPGNSVDAGFRWHSTSTFSKTFYMRAAGGSYGILQIAASLLADTWYHIGCRYDGTDMTVWVDGSLDNTVAASAPGTANTRLNLLAGANGTFAHSEGHLAEVGYWKTALTDAQMGLLGAGIPPNLVGTTPFLYCPLADPIYDLYGGALVTANTSVTANPPDIDPLAGFLERPPWPSPYPYRTEIVSY